ncbi:hypothetical protein WSM22_40080 [Cytophagales bacterium WSM2-2]|nr:hypothetical protein WSM22_40080 [Cytophagales bacterium WSM2-2]
MKKYIRISFLFAVTVACLGPSVLHAQQTIISGATSSMLNETKTYTVSLYDINNDPVVPVGGSFQWYATGGSVSSSNRSQADIQWSSYGTDFVEYTFDNFSDFYYGILYVGVVVPDPTGSFNYTYSCNSTLVTRTGSPPSGVDWFWQTSDSGTSTSLGSAASITRTTNASLYLRARSQDGTWSPNASIWTGSIIIISTPTGGGSIAGSTTICSSTVPGTLTSTLVGQSGDGIVNYQWEQSSDNTNWSNVSGATSATYSPGSLTAKTYYRRKTSAICGTAYSNVVTIDIYPTLTSGSISSSTTICYNTSPGTLSGTAASGATGYQWFVGGGGWNLISGATSQSYTPGNLTATTTYERVAIGPCNTLESNVVTITVNPTLNQGTIGGTQSICSGSTASLTNSASASGGNGTYSYQWQSSPDNSSWSDISGAVSATYTTGTLTSSTYFRRKAVSCGETKFTSQVLVSVDATTNGGTLSGSAEAFLMRSGSLSLSANNGSIIKWQSRVGAGSWNDITNTLASLTYSNITSTTSYRVVCQNGVCAQAFSSEATITIDNAPVVTASAAKITIGPVVLDAGANYSTYTWKDKNGTTIGSARTLSTSVAGDYTVVVTKGGASGSGTNTYTLLGQMENTNYIAVKTVLVKDKQNDADVENLTIDNVSQSIQYFDGIGRPLQTVTTQGSPQKKDIVQPVVYDLAGREADHYLPYASTAVDGQLKANATTAQLSFYNTGGVVAQDSRPYSQTTFEASQLGRPASQRGEGQDWASTNTTKYQYLVNDNSAEHVIAWKINSGIPQPRSASAPWIDANGNYTTGQLSVKVVTDEQGHQVREYTDRLGRVILRKAQAVETPSLNNSNHWTQTYYIYDDFGLLRFVLQPELVKRFVDGTITTIIQTDLDKLAFQYSYDERKRMIRKQSPGAGAVCMVYDDLDRVVMLQDAVQKDAFNWTVSKYDALNRPVITALYHHSADIDQSTMKGLLATNNTTYINESYDGTTTHGYTNNVWPTSLTILTVNYYDNYDFVTDLSLGSSFQFKNDDISGQEASRNEVVTGYVTGVKTNLIGSSNYLYSVTYYDGKFRSVQSILQNTKTGVNRTTNLLDFPGKIVKNLRTYVVSSATTSVLESFTYDHAGRVTATKHSLNSGTEIVISKPAYNELGQVIEKNLHSADGGANFKQSVDFRYNIRGWLTRINQSDVTSVASGDAIKDYFGMEFAYVNPFASLGGNAYFNGNISTIKWSNGSSKQQAYAFSYDALNRLTDARHLDNDSTLMNGTWTPHYYAYSERGITYDMNGNIKSLNRYGFFGSAMDKLTYNYTSGNRLSSVVDIGDASGFTNGTTGSDADDYAYDKNGNMTQDKNKNITTVSYNYMNLAERATKGTGDYVQYTYDASGRKWAQQVTGATAKTTDYIGELVFEGNALKIIQTSEGRVLPDGANWEYQYDLKDHLGNVHVTFTTKQQQTSTYTAGFETANQTSERSTFSPSYPPDGSGVISTVAPNAHSGNNSLWLNGGYNGQVGLAKNFSVMPGDQVSLQAYAKYSTPSGTGAGTSSFVAALLAAFNLQAPASGETGTAAAGVNTFGNWEIGSGGDRNGSDAMKIFATIILFDRNYNFIDVAYQAVQSDGSLNVNYTVKEAGYAYLYVSNEHPYLTDVYFDDITMARTPSLIVSTSDYTPFGLSYRKGQAQGSVEQSNLYNAKELQDELALNWYDFGARMYMPEIGRWGVVDPLAEKNRRWSPYTYAMNNPVRFIDPDGMDPDDVVDTNLSPEGGTAQVFPQGEEIYNTVAYEPDLDLWGDLRRRYPDWAGYGGNSWSDESDWGYAGMDIQQDDPNMKKVLGIVSKYSMYGEKNPINWIIDYDLKEVKKYEGGVTDPFLTNGKRNIYLSPENFNGQPDELDALFIVMGHEFVHSIDYDKRFDDLLYTKYSANDVQNILEYRGYSFGAVAEQARGVSIGQASMRDFYKAKLPVGYLGK